ncbi:hypothetical protein GCM10007385_44620 [Tateyamaria omphalii]|uniref:GSCFA domain-containing protein n=1 Tax=Tateyamaria omphalii TaxID=299262 RepID=UPI0016730481|nr:GSCFA domain-containing protein [Tateyamaria omphalii]GGX70636.1 hypothetical protein GCM10007385_44620 [Tateyamaria omphalii]
MLKLPGAIAFSQALRNKARRFPDRDDARYHDHYIYPNISPGFAISAGERVFTIGSCFARNVEEALAENGMDLPTLAFTAPQDEAPGRANRILNQYNPATMLQAVRAAGTAADTRGLYKTGLGSYVDTLLATGSRAVSHARAMERREQINTLYQDGLNGAGVVVITLGLVEAWYDSEDGLYLNEAPPHKLVKKSGERFEFHQLGVEECESMVSQMLELLLSEGKRNVVLTVSPVPLQVTFAGGDALLRNSYSKSVLRVVAEKMSQKFEAVDYFPSYEIITSSGLRSFGEDNVHVRPRIVGDVVKHMVGLYTKQNDAH